MVNGRLVCLGSASQLKAAHGMAPWIPLERAMACCSTFLCFVRYLSLNLKLLRFKLVFGAFVKVVEWEKVWDCLGYFVHACDVCDCLHVAARPAPI